MEQNNSVRIPRVFHRIWLGSKPLPDYAIEYGESWLKHHPGWELKLWMDTDLSSLNIVNRKRFEASNNYGFKGDVLRLELMRLYGGVYLDTDFECQKSIEPLLQGLGAFAGYTEPREGNFEFVSSFEQAILGSVPYHPLFESAVSEHEKWMEEHEQDNDLVKAAAWYLANKIVEIYGSAASDIRRDRTEPVLLEDFALFPSRFFYPYNHMEMHFAHYEYPDAYAIHRIKGSWHEP